jgi:hypothetical protein
MGILFLVVTIVAILLPFSIFKWLLPSKNISTLHPAMQFFNKIAGFYPLLSLVIVVLIVIVDHTQNDIFSFSFAVLHFLFVPFLTAVRACYGVKPVSDHAAIALNLAITWLYFMGVLLNYPPGTPFFGPETHLFG